MDVALVDTTPLGIKNEDAWYWIEEGYFKMDILSSVTNYTRVLKQSKLKITPR